MGSVVAGWRFAEGELHATVEPLAHAGLVHDKAAGVLHARHLALAGGGRNQPPARNMAQWPHTVGNSSRLGGSVCTSCHSPSDCKSSVMRTRTAVI